MSDTPGFSIPKSRRMFRCITLALALAFSLQAQAAPASQASVEKTLDLMHAEQSVQAIWGPVEANMRQTIARSHGNTPATPEQQANEDRMIKRAMDVMHQEMNWQKMKPQYVKLYEDTFSQEEIDGLNAFYTSKAGQAYLAKMPLLMQHSMQLMQVQMQTLMPRMMQIMQDTMAPAASASAAH
jgi:hypothetical protein